MLNNKNDLSMIPTINNDGHSYIIPMDMYKEGYWAYNISNYFKARVDDNGTPFMIRWYKHGQLANVLNLRPFIRGRVGGYTIDDSNATADPKIVMDENASTVDWTGETTDTQAGGIAVYRAVNQCYPQSGIFYGQVGLRSADGDTVVTGIDIIFKVLDGNIDMLGAKKYYVSELTKAMLEFEAKMDQHDRDYQAKLTQQEQEYQAKMDQNDKDFKSKTDQVIADARDAYTKETKNTHDALVAAQAQIQANRDEQADLSNRLAGTEQQIKIHNVATLDQFATLSKQALERLSSIGAQPKYYDTVDAMKSANPNGTNDLCETVDDGHRWLYINGVWQDCGAVQDNAFKAARDASQNIMYGQDIFNWERTTEGTINQATEEFAQFENQHIMHAGSDKLSQYVRITSPVLDIDYNVISLQLPEMTKNLTDTQGGTYVEIQQFTPKDDPDNDTTGWGNNDIRLHFASSEMTLWKYPNIKLNPDVNRIRFQYVMYNTLGDMYVGTPMLNYGETCIPYSQLSGTKEFQKALSYEKRTSLNLLYSKELNDMSLSNPDKATIKNIQREQFPGINLIDFINNDANTWNVYRTPIFKVKSGATISIQVPGRVVSGNALLSIQEFKDEWQIEKVNETFFKQSNRLGLNKFDNIKLNSDTEYVLITISLNGKGEVIFGMPKVNYGDTCIPYNQFERKSDNLLKYSNFSFDTSMGIYTLDREDAKEVSFNTIDNHNQYPNLDFARIPIKNTHVSLQVPYQSTGNLWVQLRYSSDMSDDPAKNFVYTLPASKDRKLTKFEGIKLPDDAKYVKLRIWPEDKIQGKIWLPKINYGDSCMPYEKYAQSNSPQKEAIAKLYISSEPENYNKIVPFEYLSNSENFSGYINYDIQGNSSRSYAKKNLKIKLFADGEGKTKLKVKLLQSWKKNDKYNLKANWIDATQARNIVNARLVKDAVAITPIANPSKVLITDTPDLGQMNGVPVEVYFNNGFYGLYTFNTKKDDVTFAMDSKNDQHEVVSVDISHDAFSSASASIDKINYETEIHDTASDTVNSNFTKFMNFINNSTDVDFKAHISDYIDVQSVINELLFGTFSTEYDFYAKSILLATWTGGEYWYMIPYDLDSTWGLDWDGSKVSSTTDDYFNLELALQDSQKAGAIGKFENGNKLLSRIYQLFKPEIKAQGQKLRETVWSTSEIIKKFRDFIDSIPVDSYEKEQHKWSLPSVNITSFNQIQSFVIKRGQEFDDFLSQLA